MGRGHRTVQADTQRRREGRAQPGWPGARQNWAIGALAHEPYRQAVANTRIGDLVASTPKPGGPRPAQKIDGFGV